MIKKPKAKTKSLKLTSRKKYLLTPLEYKLPNPRIDGFRKLKEVNSRTVDIFVFSLESFAYFLDNNELSPKFTEELRMVSEKMIENAPTHAAVVRRAFVVPGLENPPGPYFLGLANPEAVIEAVKQLYQFAISQRYHEPKGSQISGFIYAFVDPSKFDKEKLNILSIPYGGYAVSQNEAVEIYAVFGNNEGVQSLVADRYMVEVRRNKFFIVKKDIPQKSLMYCTTIKSQRDTIQVPSEIQFDQVLSDNEILEVARVVSELSQKYGPQRVELSSDEKGIIFNEVADYWKEKTAEISTAQVRGKVITINSVSDLQKLSTADKDKLKTGQVIALIGETVIASRNYDILGALATWKDNLYVLYPGVAATQHAMRVLADKGHKAFLVGMQKFKEGDEVQITTAGGKVRVTNLSRTENQKFTSLWDASLFGVELCGGKANRLSELKILGFQVPHGSVIATVVYDEILKSLGFELPLGLNKFSEIYDILLFRNLKNSEINKEHEHERRVRMFKSPNQQILKLIDELIIDYRNSNRNFAVRSSATIEDNIKQSMAGMFETFLNVPPKEISGKVIEVMRSAFAPKIVEYLRANPDLIEKLKMAVIIQDLIPAEIAGVIFGAKVQTKDTDIVEIEANLGLGEGIVSGEAKEIEQYKFSRSEKRVIERKGPQILTPSQAKALFLLSERLRSEFSNTPQDIEWAIDKAGQIWVLQSRDLYLG